MWPRLWQRFCWADSYPRELKCRDGGERFVPGKWTIPDSLVVWQRLENTACRNNVTRVNRHFFAICQALASFFIEGKDCKGKSFLAERMMGGQLSPVLWSSRQLGKSLGFEASAVSNLQSIPSPIPPQPPFSPFFRISFVLFRSLVRHFTFVKIWVKHFPDCQCTLKLKAYSNISQSVFWILCPVGYSRNKGLQKPCILFPLTVHQVL